MSGRFQAKRVIVTGAASGIGRATAEAFAAEGAQLLIADISEVGLLETQRLLEQYDTKAELFVLDIRSSAGVGEMVERAVSVFGGLDIAFNNAGIDRNGPHLADVDEAVFDEIVEVNLKGCFLCMKHEIPAMLQAGGGAIVNTASIRGVLGRPGLSPYAASKHGVVGMTKSAAIEYAARNVRINAICPGATDTPMFGDWGGKPEMLQRVLGEIPAHRIASPAEIARSVLFLASEDASFVTGHAMLVDGGQSAM